MATLVTDSFERFDQVGGTIPVDADDRQSGSHLPAWFDRDRFERAKSVVDRHFFSIFFTHLSGLVLLVFIRSIHRTLATSGKSLDLVSIFFRYWHTILHIKLWYEGDICDPNDRAHRSLQTVSAFWSRCSTCSLSPSFRFIPGQTNAPECGRGPKPGPGGGCGPAGAIAARHDPDPGNTGLHFQREN